MLDDNQQELHTKLNSEAAKMPWRELQRHYARGVIIVAAADMDLIATAARLASDDREAVEAWLTEGELRRADDDDAKAWLERDAVLWTVVVAPWVLVQEQACSITG